MKKLLGIILLLLWLLMPSSAFAQVQPTKRPQDVPYTAIPPKKDLMNNPNANPEAIKKLFNLWLNQHHIAQIGFLKNINLTKFILLSFVGIIVICFGLLGLILTLRYSLFKKRLLVNQENKVFLNLKAPSQTAQSAYATQQLFEFLHSHHRIEEQPLWRRFLIFVGFPIQKNILSLEIISTKEDGIRYIIQTNKKDAAILEKTLISYLPGVHIDKLGGSSDYLPEDVLEFKNKKKKVISIAEYSLSSHFSIPLQDLKTLDHYDPIAYITGHMTKLEGGEMVSMQIVLSPISSLTQESISNTISSLQDRIWNELVISDIIHSPRFIPEVVRKVVTIPLKILVIWIFFWLWVLAQAIHFIMHFFIKGEEPFLPWWPFGGKPKKVTKTPKQELLYKSIGSKIDGSLFEGSIRLFVAMNSKEGNKERVTGFTDSLSPFTNPSLQSVVTQRDFSEKLWNLIDKITGKNFFYRFLFFKLKNRLISFNTSSNPILSVSEITDLYHLPYSDTTKTEGLIKSKSSNLPAPQSFKRSTTNLDVVVGKNIYGGEETPIGQTLAQRRKHTYIIGKTGMGKTEMLKTMICQDMVSGKGLAVLDPHGDLFYELLRIVPKNRRKDVIVFNPADKEYPVGLNILSSGIKFTDEEEGYDWITSTTLAVFKKLTDEKYWGPRLEHILRNASMSALTTSSPSLFIIQKLLTGTKDYQKKVADSLKDPILKQFWNSEFSLYGKMQQAEVVSPITNRLGKFITSIMSRNILLQERSTVNIQHIMDEGKILLVNLSKGELGEDQSFFFGSLIISLIQLAAYQRIHVPESQRRDFFLYVDEFQNFATHIFEEMSSEGRKWHVPLITSHQNIAQIRDTNLLQIVAENADTIIAQKSGPDGERFILPFMEPEVEKGSIVNLPPYHFFMKVTNDDSEDAFSGETELLDVKGSDEVAKEVIDYSRKHYTTPRKEVEKYLEKLFGVDEEKTVKKNKPENQKPSKNSPRKRKVNVV